MTTLPLTGAPTTGARPRRAGEAAPVDTFSVWPATTTEQPHGRLLVGGVSLTELAESHGTPVYVLDEAEVRERCRTYRSAFPDAGIHYAAKAFLCRALAHWVEEEGLGLDVCSAGELELAAATGFPADRILLHGNAKSPQDLETALRLGVGRIVIDTPAEIARIAAAVGTGGRQKVMVRVTPGISAGGHRKIRTGSEDQKFGLSLRDGHAQHAIARILDQPQLELTGIHCHLGSQITDVKPYLVAVHAARGPHGEGSRHPWRHAAGARSRRRSRHRPPSRRTLAGPHHARPCGSAPNSRRAVRRPGFPCRA